MSELNNNIINITGSFRGASLVKYESSVNFQVNLVGCYFGGSGETPSRHRVISQDL